MADSSGKGANGESGADVGSLSADISEDLAAMETEAEGDSGQKGGESALPSAMGGQMTPASVGTRSPRLSAAASGGATMVEEDERGEQSVHEFKKTGMGEREREREREGRASGK